MLYMEGKAMEYTNSQISAIIDEYIHSERDRRILKRRLKQIEDVAEVNAMLAQFR